MKTMENFRLAFYALRQTDRRAQLILLVSLLLALGSMYMLLWSGGRGGEAIPSASPVYEPVDSIARFRGERERVRAVEVQQLNALIQDAAAGQDLKDRAREKLVQLTEWMEQETTVEGILRAEGYVDPLVTVHADSVNVLVHLETLTQADAARILSLAARETGETGGNIKVIPVSSSGG